jgi:ADP-ribosylation factor-like protein 1
MFLCLGPTGSGKTLLLKRLQNKEVIDITSNPTPTVGVNIFKIQLAPQKEITVREVGGAMAAIWRNYYTGIKHVIYVVDTSNLCQISAAGTMFYGILAEPLLKHARVSFLHSVIVVYMVCSFIGTDHFNLVWTGPTVNK